MTNPNHDKDAKARLTYDIKHFLKPFFTFRLYVKFKANNKKSHFYGNEHQCTYNQLLYGQVPNIEMSRLKGYTDLINLVENTWKHKLTSATIYMRSDGSEKFDTACREYYNGELKDINDPVIDDSNDKRTLYYYFQNYRLFITTEDPAATDFKKEITDALTNKPTDK